MNLWTKSEFQRVAQRTRLSDRTLAACQDVLIDGTPGVDAAAKHKIFTSSLSRALGVLNEKRTAMLQSTQMLASNEAILRMTAAEMAKNLLGEDLPIKDAVRGRSYEGQVIVNAHGFLVQKVGRSGVVHDLRDLTGIPPRNTNVAIAYPANDGPAVFSVVPDKTKEKSTER